MSYIVTGFYTANYSGLSRRLRDNLDAYSIPHAIYPVEHIGETWLAQPLRKPSIVLRAMEEHPGRTVVLMDVDCTVHGPIDPIISDAADISIFLRTDRQYRVHCSSRVVVFRPTQPTVDLLKAWQASCQDALDRLASVRAPATKSRSRSLIAENDETLLMRAITLQKNLTIKMLPIEYAGNAHGLVPDAVISHDSAHDKVLPRKGPSFFKLAKRRIVEALTGMSYDEWRGKPPAVKWL